MPEKHYVFIKNNKIANIAVFADKDDELAQRIVEEQGYDGLVWIGDAKMPSSNAIYNGTEFVEPTEEELIAVGLAYTLDATPAE